MPLGATWSGPSGPAGTSGAALATATAAAATLRKIATELYLLGTTAGAAGRASADGELRERLASGAEDALLDLKAAGREALMATEALKAGVQEAKDSVDRHHLQLQNLWYERSHLTREIRQCKEFVTPETGRVSMVSVEEFGATAGALATTQDPHQLQLNRMEFELRCRQNLLEQLQQLTEQRKALQAQLADKKKFLETIPAEVKAVAKSTENLQKHLNMQVSRGAERAAAAASLPMPLYVLFCQAEGLPDVAEHALQVQIMSDEGDAAGGAGSTKRPAADAAADRAAKRARVDEAANAKSNEQPSLFDTHPVSLVLRLRRMNTSVSLRFRYLSKLQVVTVELEGMETVLLSNLFPGDTGEELPNAAAHHAHGQSWKGIQLPATVAGRPFRWAQWLCGIQAPPAQQEVSAAASTRRIVQLLRARIMALQEVNQILRQVTEMGANAVPVHESVAGLFTSTPHAELAVFEAVPSGSVDMSLFQEQVRTTTEARDLGPKSAPEEAIDTNVELSEVEGMLLAVVSGASANPIVARTATAGHEGDAHGRASGSHWSQAGARYYRAIFRSRRACLFALVQIPAEYPQRPSSVVVCNVADTNARSPSFRPPATDATTRSIEAQVNGAVSELTPTPDSRVWLLAHQLRRIQQLFFASSQKPASAAASAAAATAAAESGTRVHRGRDRHAS